MAALVSNIPLPLLLDSLLASSWTWLALSLATIATLLRALSRIPFCRHRPQALLPPPSIFSVETEHISSFLSDLSCPLQKSHKRWSTCKSSPAFKTLVQSHDGLACFEFESLFCLRNPDSPQRFRKVASTSQIRLLCGSTSNSSKGALNSGIDCTLGLGFRLGFLVDTQESVSRTVTQGLIEKEDNTHHLRTSDVFPTCNPPQKALLNISRSQLNVPPCFEKQFGWCKLLDTKLGLSWQLGTSNFSLELAVHNPSSVKVWSAHERNLFGALKIKRNSVRALDVDITGGLACIAQTNREISHWDVANEACLSRVCSNVDTISALCLKADSRFAIAGSCNGFNLWDCRSPNFIPILKGGVNLHPYQTIACEDNALCIHQSNGFHQLCELRKPQWGCMTSTRTAPASSRMEAQQLYSLWEKLSCDDDEDSWDEPVLNDMDVFQKSNTFTSRCVTLVRSLSSSGR